jgi:signal transduction histidine kinase
MEQDKAAPGTRAAYEHETAPLLRQRVRAFAATFAFFMGVGVLVECLTFPERQVLVLWVYGAEVAVCLAAIGAMGWRLTRRGPRAIGATMTALLAALVVAYNSAVDAPAERVAMVLGSVLSILSVLEPWGWVAQAVAGFVSLLSFCAATASGALPITRDDPSMPMVALAAIGTAATLAAHFLDRYRFEAFRHTALQTEEAEIAATLLRVSRTLSAYLGQPDLLGRVNRLAMEAVGCEWSSLFLLDDDGTHWQLASNAGSTSEVRAELAQVRFPADALPLFREFRPGELIEIDDPEQQALVPVEMLRRFNTSSALYAPIVRGERIVGVLVNGYASRPGPFSERQRRLTIGMAHALAPALETGRLIAELQAASRLKSQFVATMSHELRTPLNVISGYTEMLADREVDPASGAWTDLVNRIQRSALELNDLVSATLDMNRLEVGHEPVNRERVVVETICLRLDGDVQPLVQPGVTLRWQLDLGHAAIVTDGVKLRTIIKNLVVNALKFTSSGVVEMRAETDEDALVVTVRDTGIGIAPEHQTMIFDMFRQVDGTSTRRFGGVGLGLHIVERLVRLLGGTVSVASAPGQGSTFTVRLPGSVRAALDVHRV